MNGIRRMNRADILYLAAIALVLFIVFSRIVGNVLAPTGSHDFHPYWYQGHAVWRGSNPYRAFLDGETPALPLRYLDGVEATEPPVAQPGLSTSVTNTAPLALLLALFSFLSWPVAKLGWLAINLGLILALPWLLMRAWPFEGFTRSQRLALSLLVYAFGFTRHPVSIGQTTLPVLCLLLASLALSERHWFWSGICLGIALSKYSLALPILLFLLIEFKRRGLYAVAVALLVQVAGVLAITLISGDAPLTVLGYYRQIMGLFGGHLTYGVQLGVLFPLGSPLAPLANILLTLVVAVFVGLWLARRARGSSALARYCLLTILVLWAFLVAYNGGYDLLVIIVVVPLWMRAFSGEPALENEKRPILALLAASWGTMSLPYDVLNDRLLHLTYQALDGFLARAYAIDLLLLLAASLWLFWRLLTSTQANKGAELAA